jgi:hypothetical protein
VQGAEKRPSDVWRRSRPKCESCVAPGINAAALSASCGACAAALQMDPDCAKVVQAQPDGHRATMPSGPDPKCAVVAATVQSSVAPSGVHPVLRGNTHAAHAPHARVAGGATCGVLARVRRRVQPSTPS